jgi:hypothetical protein
MSIEVPFTLQQANVIICDWKDGDLKDLFTHYSELFRKNYDEANKLLLQNKKITQDLVNILVKGKLTNVTNTTRYDFWERIAKILRLSDSLGIHGLSTDYNDKIVTNKHVEMTYFTCFRLLEIRFGIKIFRNKIGKNKYDDIVPFDIIVSIFGNNDISPIRDYFKEPMLNDFINFVSKDHGFEYDKYILNCASNLVDEFGEKLNIKDHSEVLYNILSDEKFNQMRIANTKKYKIILLKIIKFLNNSICGEEFSLINILLFVVNLEWLLVHIKSNFIAAIDTKLDNIPLTSEEIHTYIINNKQKIIFHIITHHLDLFTALVSFYSKYRSNVIKFFTLHRSCKLMPSVCYFVSPSHKILYKLYPFETSNFYFENDKDRHNYNEFIGNISGKLTKAAI